MSEHPIHDSALEARLQEMVGDRRHPVAAVVVDADGMNAAWLGAEADADYEIGSVSKALTGLLYRDAIDRGEVSSDTTLGQLLVAADSTLSDITLASLAVHRSGLPRLPRSSHPLQKTWALWRRGTNPYGETLVERLKQAETVSPGRPRPRYSNLGFELLGHAVARAAGTTYSDLVATRLADPLELGGLFLPADVGDLRPSSLVGSDRRGRSREPWTGEALGPAGGIRASIIDMGRLVSALVDRTAPGIDALDPVSPFSRRARIGAGWITIDVGGFPISWHNGGTGGFRSWVGVDPQRGRGAAVLSATTRSVDPFGFSLLAATD